MSHRWTKVDSRTRGPITEVDWPYWLDGRTPLDPYLIWGDYTRLAGMGGWDGPAGRELNNGRWPLLVELASADQVLPAQAGSSCPAPTEHCDVVFGLMEIPGAYKAQVDSQSPTRSRSRYLTARVQPCAIGHLLQCASISRFQLGLPRLRATSVGPRQVPTDQTSGKRRRIVVGFIDDGCPYAHPAFQDAVGTRVRYLWDQDPAERPTDQGGWANLPTGLGYGAELGPQQLDNAVAQTQTPWAPYEHTGYVPVRLDLDVHGTRVDSPGTLRLPTRGMRRSTHGSGAMHIAAGRPPPGSPVRLCGDELDPGPSPIDDAGELPIVFVQLPAKSVLDTSGGSLGVHVLDGLRYLETRAEQLYQSPGPIGDPPQQDNPVDLVATISYGAIAGPHDGTSILERALDAFVRERVNTWLVVSAGNSHRSGTHAQLILGRGCDAGHFVWHVAPDNPLESYLEVWLPHHPLGGPTAARVAPGELPAHEFLLAVQAPGDPEPVPVRVGDVWLLPAARADTPARAGIVFARKVAQGELGTMVLLAVAPTRVPREGNARDPAPHGEWIVQVAWQPSAECNPNDPARWQGAAVHAWAERNDLLFALTRRQQSRVVSDRPVPLPTEYMPDSLRFLNARDFSGTPPWALRPEPALGSTANVEPAPDGSKQPEPARAGAPAPPNKPWRPWSLLRDGNLVPRGQVVVTGAYRLADGEMAAYSSGGPARGSSAMTIAAGVLRCSAAPALSQGRMGPDVDAPGDVGTALRGVRVAAMLAGDVARMSGTSAAAPRVARLIANLRAELARAAFSAENIDEDTVARSVGWQGARPAQPTDCGSDAARPTPSPRMDDLFRRARQRVR